MAGFIVRRILWAAPVLLLAALIAFALVSLLPFDKEVFNDRRFTDTQVETLRAQYGLDDPWHVQYRDFVTDIVTWDLGTSTKPGARTINSIVGDKLPVSMLLGALAFLLAASVGTVLGVVSALRVNGAIDYTITIVSSAAFALPSFVTATLWVNYSPLYGWEQWSYRIGPILLLGLSIMPYFVRLVRASMLEALQSEYIVTARSKGIPWRTTVVRHALRNSMIPTIVNAGPLLGFVLTGSFIIERIMTVPGIAGEFIDAFSQPLDLRLVLVTTVLLAGIIIVTNLLVDIFVSWLDPRIVND